VDRLALPYRIALIAVLAVCALWFVALRPKAAATDSTPLPAPSAATAPGTKGLGTAVEKAKGAVATSDAAAKASEQAANAASTGSALSPRPSTTAAKPAAAKAQPATPAAAKPAATKAKAAAPTAKPAKPAQPAKPAAAPAAKAKPRATAPAAGTADRSAPLLAALAKGHVAVVLFLDARAADDKAVRAAVHQATKGRAKVTTRIAPISDVGDYAAITQGVAVAQAPTVLIIGPDKKAQVLTGYVDAASITQAISQAR
jgi:hypothetical protein